MEFPEPVIRVAIEPKTKAGQEKMGIALMKLAEEDPPSGPTPTKRRVRPSSPVWASCIWRSSSTACCVSSRSRPMWALPSRLQGDRPQEGRPGYQVRRQSGGKASTVTSRSRWSPTSPARATSLSTPSWAAPSPRSISPRSTPVFRAPCSRRAGRLSRGGCEGHAVRWFLPRGGLLRNGVQDRRLHGLQGGLREADPTCWSRS